MICLTFDTDHMTAKSLEKFLARYDIPGKATFFSHVFFDCLAKTHHEICPHPFINDLSKWQDSVTKITQKFSHQAKGIRNHSCVFSHMIGVDLKKWGYIYSSNIDNLFQTNIKPYRHAWGIWELPIYYMDNMDFWMLKNWDSNSHIAFRHNLIEQALSSDYLFVFDIHPLHVALNTRSYEDYCAVKEKVIEENCCPFDLRFEGRGVAVFFEELCSALRSNNERSYSCIEALERMGCLGNS